jgi:hypothetical protein
MEDYPPQRYGEVDDIFQKPQKPVVGVGVTANFCQHNRSLWFF